MPARSARDYRDVDYTAKVAIMVGAELVGLSDAALAAADTQIGIPMRGLGTSLNVSVAVGVDPARSGAAAPCGWILRGVRGSHRAERERTLFEWCYPEIAERCRVLGREYPKLTADGMMASNPLLDVRA